MLRGRSSLLLELLHVSCCCLLLWSHCLTWPGWLLWQSLLLLQVVHHVLSNPKQGVGHVRGQHLGGGSGASLGWWGGGGG